MEGLEHVSRAISACTKTCGCDCAIASLKEAACAVRRLAGRAIQRMCLNVCAECCETRGNTADVFTFDMRQAYECLTPEGLAEALDALLPTVG